VAEDQPAVERLREASIDQPDRPALSGKLLRDLDAAHDDGPEAHDQDVFARAQELAFADGNRPRVDRLKVEARIARVMQRERMVLSECGVHQPAQLLFVLG
jgi:hypothetical protein